MAALRGITANIAALESRLEAHEKNAASHHRHSLECFEDFQDRLEELKLCFGSSPSDSHAELGGEGESFEFTEDTVFEHEEVPHV